ncbi:catechol 2,3-dioxygenase-like lactoylglutathione lyase family enzyme [Saccharopolyspora phatthalungensis]|uniref:Catechol 2,3-dioxygenase-like lactoylglutathione lyase family enzyme n=1 Tax=Saccharopolyspora phatthalungensis TaxID=664693 RepID=A0A840QF16_9PSEU|nr:VOC family protein [Saccharopolyspora phatthalungensis]MBB5157179.1 catechol 2,3-dioxygenase-like lactoylglutathione lyase family enzyme [Saccharopolyspora phatthalungensis]
MLTAAGVGLELFQFLVPEVVPSGSEMEYWRQGLWHLCFTDPDVVSAAQRVVAHGGRQVCPISTFVPGRPWRLVYCRDPWGTTLEIMSHSYAEVFSGWPQPGKTTPQSWAAPDAVGR